MTALSGRRRAGCRLAACPLVLIPALWAGMLIGVSLIATPIKFTAPTLDLAPALDVGRVTFALFSKIEWAAAALLMLAALRAYPRARPLALSSALSACLAAQGAWLLPALNDRVAAVVAGAPMPASAHHALYAGLELLKLALLAAFLLRAADKSFARSLRDPAGEPVG